MLDNEILNYTLLVIAATFIFYIIVRIVKSIEDMVTIVRDGGNKLKSVGDGVENINNIVTENMEPISNGINNISEMVATVKGVIVNVSERINRPRVEQPVERRVIEHKPLEGQELL